jgi:hypothetical protein
MRRDRFLGSSRYIIINIINFTLFLMRVCVLFAWLCVFVSLEILPAREIIYVISVLDFRTGKSRRPTIPIVSFSERERKFTR